MENSVLPPLSIDKSNYTSVQSEHEVNLPPLDTPIDEVLQHHLIRVQETLIDSADAKVSEIKQKLNENQLMLQRTIDEKSRSNVALFRVKKDVNILNKALYGVRKELDQREVDQTTLEQECDASSRYIKDLLKENNGLSDNFKKLQKQFEEAQLKIKQLHDINTNYTSEVKIHKRINAKLKKEMELTVAKSKLAEAALAAEKERNEMLYHSKKGLEGTLLQQQSEVTTSQLAINVLHSENNDLIKIKSATEKQWEEAMTAMSNRDKTIQAMADHRDTVTSKMVEYKTINSVLKSEREELAKCLVSRDQECEEYARKVMTLQNELRSTKQTLSDSQHALSQCHIAEASYKSEIDKLKNRQQKNENDQDHNVAMIASLKSKISEMKADFDEKLRFQISVEEAYKLEEEIQTEAQKEIRAVIREEDSKNIDLRRENAKLKVELHKKVQELAIMKKTHENLRKQHTDINNHYSKLHEEAKEMIYTLERKEHDLNLLKAKSAEYEEDHRETFNVIISGLRMDLETLQKEKDRIQSLWLESQKELLTEQSNYKKLKQENDLLETKLGISDGVKVKTDRGLNEVKSESLEHKLEAAKLYNELRNLQPVIHELKEKNKKLQHQLHEATLKLDEAHLNNTTTKQLLRTEIRRLSQDRSGLRLQKAEQEKSLLVVEKDTQVYKEIIEKLKSERYELQRQVFALKRRADETERKYFDLKLKQRKSEIVEAKRQAADLQKFAKQPNLNQVSRHQQQTVNKSTSEVKSGDQPIQDLPDFDAWRLRIKSLTTEKEYLVNENKVLKKKLDDFSNKVRDSHHSIKQLEEKNRALETNETEMLDKLNMMDSRYARAKKVAAHIEKQMKEAKPNSKIDYQLIDDPEPSTQLLAAILSKDPIKRMVKS